VPVEHVPQVKLPAVSGSSGRLVVERFSSQTPPPDWPGAVFALPELSYEAAMQHYLATTRQRLSQAKGEKAVTTGRKAAKQALRRAEEALREERYQVRECRKQEDALWQALRQQLRAERTRWKAEGRSWPGKWAAWETRRALLAQRQREDERWRAQRQQLRQQAKDAGQVSAWLAILVVIDNCTRQCFGLPLFVTGAQGTAQQVVEALEALLPAELQYLISDQGSHFRTRVFAQLAERKDFLWVPIARHRPQSNGIAERFVRTLKEWLAGQVWQSSEELAQLLGEFLPGYNDRPHQGLPIPGLSPNEFAGRIWLM
jgi:transposase InsO family protein